MKEIRHEIEKIHSLKEVIIGLDCLTQLRRSNGDFIGISFGIVHEEFATDASIIEVLQSENLLQDEVKAMKSRGF